MIKTNWPNVLLLDTKSARTEVSLLITCVSGQVRMISVSGGEKITSVSGGNKFPCKLVLGQ